MPRLPMLMVRQIVEVVRDPAGELADCFHLFAIDAACSANRGARLLIERVGCAAWSQHQR